MTQDQDQDVNFIVNIAKALVDFPEDVRVERKVDEMGVLLILHVDKRDMGKIIGRNGSIVNAMRTLLRALGMRLHARLNLKIYEPEGTRREDRVESASVAPAQTQEDIAVISSDGEGDDPTSVEDLVS